MATTITTTAVRRHGPWQQDQCGSSSGSTGTPVPSVPEAATCAIPTLVWPGGPTPDPEPLPLWTLTPRHRSCLPLLWGGCREEVDSPRSSPLGACLPESCHVGARPTAHRRDSSLFWHRGTDREGTSEDLEPLPQAARRHGWGCRLHEAGRSWGQVGALPLPSWQGGSSSVQLQPPCWLQTLAYPWTWGPGSLPPLTL